MPRKSTQNTGTPLAIWRTGWAGTAAIAREGCQSAWRSSTWPPRACIRIASWTGTTFCSVVPTAIPSRTTRTLPTTISLWPDRHNTMLALAYSRGGFVRIAEGLTPDLQRRARALMELVGLDRHIQDAGGQPAKRDQRWMDREEAWATAELFRSRFESLGGTDEVRSSVVDAARYCGLFSVWFAVFEQHSDVKLALIDAFPGTATSCFDQDGSLVNRPGAEI